jgi:F0F1-type ATP synthase assembly protein I
MAEKSIYARMGRLSAIVMILPASMAGGWIGGYYLIDNNFQTYPWGSLILAFLGAGAGFYEIFKILTLDQRKIP